MNDENVTDIEQSKRLEELIGCETADMFWEKSLVKVGEGKFEDKYALGYGKIVSATAYPAWSFGALVDLVPVDQLGIWRMNALTMYDGFAFCTDSPVGGHYYKGKTKLEAVYNAVVDIYERRAQR